MMSKSRIAQTAIALLATLLLVSCGGDPADTNPPGNSSWRTLAPIADGPRQENGVALLNGEIYVVGGFDESRAIVTDVEAFNPSTNTWRRLAPLPTPLHHPNVAVAGGRLYVVGALETMAFTATGVTLEYNPATNSWAQRAPMPAGSQRGASAVAAIGDRIYVAGGFRGGSVAEFSYYDVVANTWTALAALPGARDHLVGAAVNGLFYAIAGRNGSTLSGAVNIYNPVTNAWATGASMPTPRGGCMSGIVNGVIHVVGGEGNTAVGTGIFEQHEAYDPATDTWTTREKMRTPRHGSGAIGVNGVLYVPGGATVQGFGAVNINEAFTP
jgi:N-acetylneuraminic acid mutarotase